jgi:hypothetical protein
MKVDTVKCKKPVKDAGNKIAKCEECGRKEALKSWDNPYTGKEKQLCESCLEKEKERFKKNIGLDSKTKDGLITEYKRFDIFEDRTPQKTINRILSVGHGVSEGGEIKVKYDYYAEGKGSYKGQHLKDNNLENLKSQIDKFNTRMSNYDFKLADEELKKGDLVRFRRVVDPDDDKIVMRLLENPDGGRVLVESLIWDALNPTRVLPTSELIKDSETKDVIKNKK